MENGASILDITGADGPAREAAGPALSTGLLRFVHVLRDAGVPVSMVEALDAVDAVRHIDIGDRAAFRAALAATLVKRAEHQATFQGLFEMVFAPTRDTGPDRLVREIETSLDRVAEAGGEPGARSDGEPSMDLLQALLDAIRSGDPDALRALSARAVEQHAGISADRGTSERYYLYRVLRQLELSELLRQAMAAERAEGDRTQLEERLLREEFSARLEGFRRMIAQEVRRHVQALPDRGDPAAALSGKPLEDVDFLRASPAELREMREAIRPLARKLAARIARRRRLRRRGRLDVRRTIRRSLPAGGVPLDPAFRHPRATKPALYLLCDISGSVAEFARFTMSLLYAMKEEFSKIRLFVFVDGIDEVTEILDEGAHELAPRNLLYRTKAIAADGHSDYGNVLERFWHVCGYADLDQRTTVIITGDARNNYRASGIETLRLIQERSRHVYWLNPEPRAEWNTTDSIMDVYADACHGVFEASTLRQLAEFVYQIARA